MQVRVAVEVDVLVTVMLADCVLHANVDILVTRSGDAKFSYGKELGPFFQSLQTANVNSLDISNNKAGHSVSGFVYCVGGVTVLGCKAR